MISKELSVTLFKKKSVIICDIILSPYNNNKLWYASVRSTHKKSYNKQINKTSKHDTCSSFAVYVRNKFIFVIYSFTHLSNSNTTALILESHKLYQEEIYILFVTWANPEWSNDNKRFWHNQLINIFNTFRLIHPLIHDLPVLLAFRLSELVSVSSIIFLVYMR